MQLAKSVGGVVGVLLLIGIVLLLTRGHPKPPPKSKLEQRPIAPTSAGVQDAFAFAKALQSKLGSDPKYAGIYLVPSQATADQKSGKVRSEERRVGKECRL